MNTTERSATAATVLNIAPERPINLRARLVLVDIVMLSIGWLFVLFYGDRHGRTLVDGLILSGVAVAASSCRDSSGRLRCSLPAC
jgi:hypothetical protein